jgi:hypothetical protein
MNPGICVRLMGIAAAALVVGACSGTPTSATSTFDPVEPARGMAAVRLSNLRGSYIGRANKICDGVDSTMAVDQLSFDYEVQDADLSGALLVKCDNGNCMSGVPLGTVASCPKPPSPCDPDIRDALEQGLVPACLTGNPAGRGTVKVLAMTPWEEVSTYLVMAFFEDSGKRSNTVSTTVGHLVP